LLGARKRDGERDRSGAKSPGGRVRRRCVAEEPIADSGPLYDTTVPEQRLSGSDAGDSLGEQPMTLGSGVDSIVKQVRPVG
jgi:hypothetical protein